jgi:hypothetical protein
MTATITPIHSRQTSTRSGTVMLFGNPPAAARQQPGTAFKGDPTT